MHVERNSQFLSRKTAAGRQTNSSGEHVRLDFNGISTRGSAVIPQSHLRRRWTVFVVAQEQLVAYGSVGGDQVMPRPRHPIHHLVIFRNVGVEYSKRADHLAPDIRKERILYFVGITEPLQNFARVIGYRRGIYSVRLETFDGELQLNELVAAVGSPISAAPEDQQHPVCSWQIVQRANLTFLVGEGKIGHPLANVGPSRVTRILCA